jgi:hypothetical protein
MPRQLRVRRATLKITGDPSQIPLSRAFNLTVLLTAAVMPAVVS